MIYERTLSYDPEQPEGEKQSEGDSPYKVVGASRSSSTITSPTRASRTETRRTHLFMFGTLGIAAAICVAHHVFMSVINGKNVEDLAIAQTWIRDIGNALSWIVQFLLQLSVGVALAQSVWLYVRGNRVTLDDLDVLFSLPAFSFVPSTLFKARVFYTIVLAIVLQAMSLVGIFAPNALSVVPASPTDSSLRVPIPALDQIPVTTSSYFLQSGSTHFYYMNPSSNFQSLARGVLDGSTIFPWSPPSGCGRACNYNVDYWGPALRCTDIPQSSIDVFNTSYTTFGLGSAPASVDPSVHVSNPTHFLEGAFVYNATTSFGFGESWSPGAGSDLTKDLIPIFQSNPYGQPFSLDVIYATNNFTLPFTAKNPVYYNLTGYSCTFHNATYTASVKYSNGSQTTTARVIEYGGQLGPIADPGSVNASDVHGSDPGFLSTYAALGLADAMSQYVYGAIAFSSDSFNDEPALAPVYTSVLSSILTTTASFNDGSNILGLSLVSTTYDSLARLLEDACTNLTASLMSDTANLGLYTQVSAVVTPDANVYLYKVSRLWLPYGIALGVALLADLYGLFCISKNGGAMQNSFSAIAASVRNPELDTLLSEPGEPLSARAQKVKLRYRTTGSIQGKRAGFTLADGGYDVEMH
ncbi:hypothetical protein PENSPDRAFT_747021 [Peniophora sp. CONT]|nr:hypothetical protein PENSPDRAFT_747021 [Peniophora sp. CONT]